MNDNNSDIEEVEYEIETIQIGSEVLYLTTISFLPIELLLNNAIQSIEISGQKVWCGSLGITEYFISNPMIIRDKTILELGAGKRVSYVFSMNI